jgi:tryptophan synthase alpha chain
MATETLASNAVDATFARLKAQGRLAFIPYVTAGYPDAAASLAIGALLARHGADILEVGIPFSDPLGDGPTIQRTSSVSLAGGMTVRGALSVAGDLAASSGKPLVMMGYYNPIMRHGLERFCADAAAAGVCGLIVPDLPVEESDELLAHCRAHNLHLIYLLAPTSTEERIAGVAVRASGFIYCMAVAGVTGARADLAADLAAFLARVRERTPLPLVVGFGISRPEHLQRLRGLANGAVVASALIDLLDSTPEAEREREVGGYVERMSAACSVS